MCCSHSKAVAWICKKCNKKWRYPVKTCIFCHSTVYPVDSGLLKVKGSTKINIKSESHKEIPYYNLLLEDDMNNKIIRKTFQNFNIGDDFSKRIETIGIKTVGIIGTGLMGKGIVEIALNGGYNVIWKSRSDGALKDGLEKVKNDLQKSMNPEAIEKLVGNIKLTSKFEDLVQSDIVIETVIEDGDIKKDIFKRLDEMCPANTILVTNTSSLSIDDIASITSKPERVLGLHFFNPVQKMILVEIVKGKNTSGKILDVVKEFVASLNKTGIVVRDSPCFIVNRVLMAYLNEAVDILKNDIAKPKEIDEAIQMGLNNPIGPFALLDLIGLDTFLEIMNNLYNKTGNKKFKPHRIIEKMVAEGRLGKKSGEGFYKY
jgi:3-hydroxybutyryl-CoA dehydrogenase